MKPKKEIKQRIKELRAEASSYEIQGLTLYTKGVNRAAQELEWVLE